MEKKDIAIPANMKLNRKSKKIGTLDPIATTSQYY